MVSRSTGEAPCSSWITARVTSGRSWSIAPSMLAMMAAVSRRADIFACSTRRAFSRWSVQIVEAPNPMISTPRMRIVILAARPQRAIARDPSTVTERRRSEGDAKYFVERGRSQEHLGQAVLHHRLHAIGDRGRADRARIFAF